MLEQSLIIINFMVEAFSHIWPYLLITIPLAVAIQMSGASKHINLAFQARPIAAIFLATAVGAFSPFCSCGVIPVVATLLIGGVPLAPVMAFWIASPSMDPEIFFLSVAMLGWKLALWRLGATLALSLSAGFMTHFISQRGWLGQQILRPQPTVSRPSYRILFQQGWQNLRNTLTVSPVLGFVAGSRPAATATCCATAEITLIDRPQATTLTATAQGSSCGTGGCNSPSEPAEATGSCSLKPASFRRRLWQETRSATLMVAKFMALAFFLEALITLYVPAEWIAGLVGRQNSGAILLAALIGVPVYTSNLAALPMISGLLAQGMNPAAALAFLIAGPTTTLPAMAAVWGLTTRRVFALYVSLSLVGAVVLGYIYSLVAWA